jgi:hypothetical protein
MNLVGYDDVETVLVPSPIRGRVFHSPRAQHIDSQRPAGAMVYSMERATRNASSGDTVPVTKMVSSLVSQLKDRKQSPWRRR